MKILLIKPPWASLITGSANLPVGLTYLAASVREIADDVAVLNSDYCKGRVPKEEFLFVEGEEELPADPFSMIRRTLISYRPNVVGISVMTPEYGNAKKVIDLVREVLPDVKIIIGGIHVTLLPEESITELKADYAVSGEGEYPFRKLIEALANESEKIDIPNVWQFKDGKVVSPERNDFLIDADDIPMPALETILNVDGQEIDYGMIFTSRGCPAACSFCATRNIWRGRVRSLSNDRIVEEVRRLRDNYNVSYIRFVDDTFTSDRNKIIDLCGRFEKLGGFFWSADTQARFLDEELLKIMLSGRCIQINIGVESGSERVYKKIKKPGLLKNTVKMIDVADKIGLSVVAYFIIGFPGETMEDIMLTYGLVKNIKALPIVSIATPYPGTAMYEEAKKYLSAEVLSDYSNLHHHSESMLNMTELSDDEWHDVKIKFHELVKRKTIEYDLNDRHYNARLLSKKMRDEKKS